jgi:hypothetical protein
MLRLAILVSCVGFLAGLVVNGNDPTQVYSKNQAATTTVCSHGESSTMVEVRGGRVVVVQPPTLSGCLP